MSYEYELQQTLLKLQGINLSYGDRVILRDVNAEIRNIHRPGMQQGQVVGILGPSGIGKTQLFRVISGLQEPTSGQVHIGPAGTDVVRGMVGVVAQNYPLFNHRTVLSNLMVAAVGANGSARDKSIAMLQRFGLVDQALAYPAQLSGGQRQRIAIAQQLLCSAWLLCMDEPVSGLDPIMKAQACALINEVATMSEENTIIVVSHDIESLVAISDHLWLIGRDHDTTGASVPGARIVVTYDLIERGLAWRPDIQKLPGFRDVVLEIKDRFPSLI